VRLRLYEEDHLIPLSLGGHPTDPRNLWPEPRSGIWSAEVKDQLEYVLWKKVCLKIIPLREAQNAIARDWTLAYRRYVTRADLVRFHAVY